MPELKIIISAENQKALEELKQLQDKLFQLQETVKNYKGDWPLTHTIETAIPRIQARIGELQGTLSKAGVAFDNFGNNTEKIALGSNKAGLALNDLSRIAQDAPYGFIGISNNLNPMIESFNRLAATEGGTKKALSAMLNGLSGPAGIGLAIGAVSALLVVFSKNITEAFEKPVDKLKKLREELAKLNEDIYKIAGAAQSNQLIGSILSEKVSNQKLDITTRQNAIIELKKLYQDNKDIQDLDIKSIDTYTANYLKSLNNKAAIQQLEIGKEKNYTSALSAANAEFKRITEERDNLIKNTYATTRQQEQGKTTQQLRDEIKANYVDILAGAQSDINKAKDSLSRNLDEVLKFKIPQKEDNKEFKKALDEKIALLEYDIRKTNEWANEQIKIHDKIRISARKAFTVDWADMLPSTKIDKSQAGLPDWYMKQRNQENPSESKIDKELPAWYNKTIALQNENTISIKNQYNEYKKFSNLLSGEITNGLMSAYDAMQNGENPIQALGDAFARMAEQIAFAVIEASIFEALLNAFPELKGVFATVGAISNAVSYSGPRASGGITNGASLAMVGEAGPEAIMPLSKLSNMINSTFNAGAMSVSSSGNSGQFVLRGQDLLLAVNRTQKASNLKGQSISLA